MWVRGCGPTGMGTSRGMWATMIQGHTALQSPCRWKQSQWMFNWTWLRPTANQQGGSGRFRNRMVGWHAGRYSAFPNAVQTSSYRLGLWHMSNHQILALGPLVIAGMPPGGYYSAQTGSIQSDLSCCCELHHQHDVQQQLCLNKNA